MKTGIILVGATAVGKTSISIKLAKRLNSEIISADSTQIYKELDILTAKVTKEEMSGIKHHLIDVVNIDEEYSVGQFNEDSLKILSMNNDDIIVIGGTGLYTDVLNHGLAKMPSKSKELRDKLEKMTIEELRALLKEKDEKTYDKIDINNKVRLVRAVEVCILSNSKMSEIQENTKPEHEYEFLNIFLNRDRENLYHRINKRVDLMFENGALLEGRKIYQKYGKKMIYIKAIGYRQMYDYFESNISYDEMIESIKKLSRNYAKRQLTWFKNKGYIEIDITNLEEDEVVEKIIYEYDKFKNEKGV